MDSWLHLSRVGSLVLLALVGARPSYAAEKPERPELFWQTGHTAAVCALTFSPDGRQVLTGGMDRTARLWDAVTGREIRCFRGHAQTVLSVAFSPDGRRALTGGLDQTARLWDATTSKEIRRFRVKTDWCVIFAVAFSPDGGHVLTAGTDNLARLWNAETGDEVRTFRGHAACVNAAVFSADGSKVLTGSQDGTARLWNAADGREIRKFGDVQSSGGRPVLAKIVFSVALSSDGRRALTGNGDKTARVWDADSGELLHTWQGNERVYSVRFSPDGKLAAAACLDGVTGLWDVASGKELRRLEGYLAAFSPDGRRVLTAHQDDMPRIWDAATGKEIVRLSSRVAQVTAVGFSPDGRRLLVASTDRKARIWDAATGREIRCLAGHEDGIVSTVFSPDGKQVLTGGGGFLDRDHTARLWNVATGEEARRFSGHTDDVAAVAFSPDGKQVLTGGGGLLDVDTSTRLWDVGSGQTRRTFPGTELKVAAVAVSPDGRYALTASGLSTRLWDLSTGAEVRRFEPAPRFVVPREVSVKGRRTTEYVDITDRVKALQDFAEHVDKKTGKADPRYPQPDMTRFPDLSNLVASVSLVSAAAFSPNGRRIATCGTDWGIYVWDAATGKLIRRIAWPIGPRYLLPGGAFSIPTGGLTALCFTGNGRVLVGGESRTVRLWDIDNGKDLVCLRGHTGAISAVAVSPDGRQVLTGSQDGTARLWDISTGRELVRLIGLRSGEDWLAATPQGYFDGSLEGRRLVSWRLGTKLYALELYEQRFRRPDLVSRAMRGLPVADRPLPPDRIPPRVSLQAEEAAAERVTVKAIAEPGAESGRIVDVHWTVDGRPLSTLKTRDIIRVEAGPRRSVYRATIDFPPGKATAVVAAVAVDDFGLFSPRARLTITSPKSAPAARGSLWVLAVGVSKYKRPEYNLGFCRADAEALSATLKRQAGLAFREVQARVLVDEQATVANIKAGLQWLRQSTSAADAALVHFSGHGIRGPRGLYYVTSEGDLGDLDRTCLNWQEVAQQLREMPSRQIIFLCDCCHAGAFGEEVASQDELAEPLVKQAGVMVFAASRGNELAAEKPAWGHGAFVRALLDGLNGKADLIPDARINMSELQTYVVDRVARLTGNRQHPYIPRIERFDPGLVIAHLRSQ